MLKVIEIKEKKYIFLSNLQMFFEYSEDAMKVIENIKKGNIKENEDYKSIKKLLDSDLEIGKQLSRRLTNFIKEDDINLNSAQINVYYGCNMMCKYCFAEDGGHNNRGVMDKKTSREIIDFISELTNNTETMYIQIVGGEPLLNMDAFEEIVSYGKRDKKLESINTVFTMTTNGTLFNDQNMEFLNKNDVTFMVSIDSNDKEQHDFLRVHKNENISSYNLIMKGFDKYKQCNYDTVHVTVTPYNLNVSEIAQALYDLGIRHIHFDLVKSEQEEFLFTEEHIKKLKEEYSKLADIIVKRILNGEKINCHPLMDNLSKIEKNRPVFTKCGVLNTMLAFDPYGDIYPCDMLMWQKYKIGSIHEGLDKEKINHLKEVLLNEDDCSGCEYRYLCGGMCLVDKLNQDKKQKELFCELKRYVCDLKIYIFDYLKRGKPNIDLSSY